MADFRRWLYAFAVVACLLQLRCASANAQSFVCSSNFTGSLPVRAEGYTEQVGDLVFQCTGGQPTASGSYGPAGQHHLVLSMPITSRLTTNTYNTGTNFTEALLTIDEPHSSLHPDRPILNCGSAGFPDQSNNVGVCLMNATGQVNPANYDPSRTYDPSADTQINRGNVFQGRQVPGNIYALTWSGVPLDAPGTSGSRILRFTNIRGNMTGLFSGSFVVPQVVASIIISGQTGLTITSNAFTVASVLPGLLGGGTGKPGATFSSLQTIPICKAEGTFYAYYDEGFQSAFKPRNLKQVTDNVTGGQGFGSYAWSGGTSWSSSDLNQNVVGSIYYSESGLENNSSYSNPSPNPPPAIGTLQTTTQNYPFQSIHGTGIEYAGKASTGTRVILQVTNVPQGIILDFPGTAEITRTSGGAQSGVALLVANANLDGTGGTPGTTGVEFISGVANGTTTITYEVLFSDPTAYERLTVPVTVSTSSPLNPPSQIVPNTNAAGGLAPSNITSNAAWGQIQTAVPQFSNSYYIPRFVYSATQTAVFNFVACTCNILFPYVTTVPPFDTGIAFANTTKDIYGTLPQAGLLSFNFFATPGGTKTTMTTTNQVPSGEVVTYSMMGGPGTANGAGLTPMGANFTGYMIAQAQFQYCHAFVFISDIGAQKVAEGYLGLILDSGHELHRGSGTTIVWSPRESLNQ